MLKFILFFTLWSINIILGQQLSGYVHSSNGEPLSGVNIYIQNTNVGTTTNADGYYSLQIQNELSEIIFSYIGFINDTLKIDFTKNTIIEKNIILKINTVELDEIVISTTQYNDAEKLILKVIENKNNYLKQIKNYTYDAYTKTILLAPKNDSLRIGGVLQTLSQGYFEYPDKFQETIISKTQTKNISAAYNIFSIGKIPNVLENNLTFDDEKIFSPLNTNALDYYSFNIIDTSFLSDQKVFNVKFHPRNNKSQLFNGKISIIDKYFAVVAVELFGENNVTTSARKNITLKENFRQFENFFWLPINVTYNSIIDLGFPGLPNIHIEQTSLISNYKINSKEFSHKYDEYIVNQKLNDNKNLWKEKQIIPLTNNERKVIHRIDSIVTNANFLKKLIFNSTQIFPIIEALPITDFNDFYHFNRVQGNYLGFGIDSKEYFKNLNVKLKYGYGFSNKLNNYSGYFKLILLDKTVYTFFEIFNKLKIVDNYNNYSIFDLTYQSLFLHNDYSDYYYHKGINIGFIFHPSTSITSQISYNSETNRKANNSTDFSIFYKDKLYRNSFNISEGKMNTISLSLEYDNQKYYDLGFSKGASFADDFTKFNFKYVYSSKSIESDFSFHQLYLNINYYKKLHPNFALNINIKSGILLGDELSQNKFHLPGNYATFSAQSIFRTITTDNFIGNKFFAIFFENNFNDLIFNVLQIPFLKNSNYDFFVFYNWGYLPDFELIQNISINKLNDKYSELGFGIGNIFTFLRFDFAWQLSNQNTNNFNFSISSLL